MARGVHPKKEVRKALKQLRAAGWTIEVAAGGSAHGWGTAMCPYQHRGDAAGMSRCVQRILSTPRSEGDHANRLRRALRKCEQDVARSELEQSE